MSKVNTFNKKIVAILITLLIIISTLLINNVVAYTTEMKSESDYNEIGTNVGDTAQTTYEDLVKYYSVLCCEHGRELASANKTILRASYGSNDVTYNAGDLTANDLGMVLFKHRVYSWDTDFSKSSYTSYTWGHYEVVSNEIATPKEAYILAEMSAELEAGTTLYYKILTNDEGEREKYYGGVFENESFYLSESETIYYVNHTYVLETEEGRYYVGLGHDSEGNSYYVYKTYSDGSLREYGGNLEYGNSKTGATVRLEGVHVEGVYYEFNGTISEPGSVAPGSGTLYLISYETVVNLEGTLYKCELEGDYSYIQIAWWSTEAGSRYNAIPVPSNTLAMEAEAFEAYILTITGKRKVSELKMIETEQKYILHDDEGNEIDSGYITAPEINYQPEWNEDANQNGEIDVTDEVTVTFDSDANQYKIGPFSINYVKEGAQIESREPVDFACITGVTLETNKGELELGKDWNFEWQYGERTEDDTSIYPNPNEVFYITIDYIEGLTEIENFHFDFKFMNAGGLYSDIQGYYFLCTWGTHVGEAVYRWYDLDEDGEVDEGENRFVYRDTWISFDDFEERREQELAHAIIGVRWYDYRELDWRGSIPKYAYIELEKNVIDSEGQIVDVKDTFMFDIYVDKKDGEGLKFFETISFQVENGHGEAKSSKIVWEGEETPEYKVIEVEYNEDKYKAEGPWTGTLTDGITEHIVNIQAVNVIKEKKGQIEINKELLDTALESETFTFDITVTGNFKYNGKEYTTENPYTTQVTVNSSTNWSWKMGENEYFIWYDEAPKYKITEIIPDNAEYELVGKIVNGNGELLDGEVIVAIATNDSNRDGGYLKVRKELQNQSGSSELFTFKIELTGNFKYDKDNINGTKTIEVSIKADEEWTSEYISWKNGEAPSYTVKEINLPEKFEFVSISNSSYTSTDLEKGIQGNMNGDVLITAINDEVEEKEGCLQIIKKSETSIDSESTGEDNVTGKEFTFKVTLEGNFKYQGNPFSEGNPYEFFVTVVADGDPWTSYPFSWTGDTAPKYTVEELSVENTEFVSISNGEKTITEKPVISGELEEDKTVTITAINRGTVILNGGHLQIAKIVKSEELLGRVFEFEVILKGKFNYGTEEVNGEKKFNVSVEAGGEDWVSPPITWNQNETAPQYTIKEINIPEDAKFVSFSNRIETVETNKITGSLKDKTIVVVSATNDTTSLDEEGYLQIVKRAQTENISGEEFTFEVTINGKFTYGENEIDGSYVETVKVKADDLNGWTSEKITWKSDNVPTYTIKETNIPEGVDLVSLSNGSQTTNTNSISGVLKDKDTIIVTAVNKKDIDVLYGRLQIEKVLYDTDGNEITGKEFIFDVTVGNTTFPVTIKSGETWRSDLFSWLATEEAPYYNVVERNNGNYTVTYENQSGQLTSEGSALVTVKVKNTVKVNKSKLKITKEMILNDKIKEQDVNDTFNFIVTINGTFKYNGRDYIDSTKRFEVALNKNLGWTWTSSEISWYEEAPSYSIEEINLPPNWTLVEMSENASGKLEKDKTTEVTCVNEWDYDTTIILTMEMGGKVWDDTPDKDNNKGNTLPNGIIDEGESGIENVLVTVYRVVTDENGNVLARLGNALVYDENDNVTLLENSSTYTDENGNWSFESIAVPAYLNDQEKSNLKSRYGETSKVSYDVEFSYDGQTYEPTKFLALKNEDGTTYSCEASQFRSASTVGRDAWLNSSTVIDNVSERKSFNSSFETITGEESIDVNGNTTGLAIGNNGSKELKYTSVDQASMTNSDNTRKVSTLETTDEDGFIYDEMILNSRTSTGGLTYPFDNKIHLKNWDKETTDVYKVTKHYSATYNYILSINLGLNERRTTDTSLEKDLNTAMVVVNGKALKYKYNRAIDLDNPDEQELLYKQIEVEDQGIDYELGLYSSDYYYRASIYNGTSTGATLDGYYTNTLNLPLDSTEMDLYLTYLISVHNESDTYDLRVNKLADYYDSNLELITANSAYDVTHKYVQEINGKEVNAVTQVAESSKAIYYSADNQEIATVNVNWSNDSNSLTGSDSVEYTRMTTDSLMNQNIVHGGRVDIYVTFRVEKDSMNDAGIYNTIKLGKRYNLAEVESFTSYYTDASTEFSLWAIPGEVTGRVDGDSAPNNINVTSLNEKKYYEDDTDSAPSIKISLNKSDRNVTGLAFEDAQTQKIEYSQYIGDGIYNPDAGDKAIKDMKTEIIEIIRIPQADGTYKEYEFGWPTNVPMVELGNKTISELTGFNQETVTNGNGEYSFNSIPAGNYIVRFVYGDDDKAMLTGNSGEQEVYNGQDYKSTTYQIGFENITDTNGNGLVDNEWHDLTNTDLSNARVSDVRDNEARRLYITSKSQTLTYENTSVLATADDKNADHTNLFGDFDSAEASDLGPVYGDGYYMYADTAKLNLSVENLYEIATGTPNNSLTTTNVGGLEVSMIDGAATVNGVGVGTTNFNYTIKNIDCGIEERSKTAIVLDKQIKEMVLRTSDGQVILDAIYDIYYEVKDNKVIASVKLNTEASIGYDKVAGLNRSNGSQGYRYIMAEGQILQGTTLEVKYQLTVFNISETDRCSAILKTLWENVNTATTEAEQTNLVNNEIAKLTTSTYNDNGKVYNNETIEYGMYFGSIYYQGKDGNTTDEVVETKIRQIIDYVDNDAVFSDVLNVSKDNSWSNTTIEYLLENNLLDPSVVQIIDSNGNITGDTRANREATSGERYAILDEEYQEYVTELRNNLVLSNDSSEDSDGSNPSLVKYLAPYAKTNSLEESSAQVTLFISRYFASESDANDIDNIAEIIKAENTVGRRDIKAIAGNVNPFQLDDTGTPIGEYRVAMAEPDSSATELITLSPPTGMDSTENRTAQLIFVILIATIILAAGIILIKKKVLDKE